jgi:ubiquinone/menaquinone biosynthesis C-methylase UbiE
MGCLHSIDVNPAAVARVRQKVQASGLSNVDVTKADAAATGLDGQSVDVEFLFGIIHSLRDLDSVLAEAYRVLKRAGTLSAQKSSWPESRLLRRFTEKGLFRFVGKTAGVYRFEKVEQH